MIPVLFILAMFGIWWLLSRTRPDKVPTILVMGYCIGGLALVGDFYCAWYVRPDAKAVPDYLLLIFGGAAGWLVGMLLSPYADEKPQFKEWGGAITTFLSGYVLGKFGDQFVTFIREGKLTRIALGEALVSANAFLICMLIVFVTRKYWEPRPTGTGAVVRNPANNTLEPSK